MAVTMHIKSLKTFSRSCFFIILILVTGIQMVAPVSAIPVLPADFYGNLTITGSPAPAGTVINATINGVERGSIVTTDVGKYGGIGTFEPKLVVYGNETDIDQVISFSLNGILAEQNSTFGQGNSTHLDLSVKGLSGTVSYQGTKTGSIIVELYNRSINGTNSPVTTTYPAASGLYIFSLPVLNNQTCWFAAYLDVNGDHSLNSQEPRGYAINRDSPITADPVIVATSFNNIDILLKDPPVVPAPEISSISPGSGPTTGGTPVTVTGTNFVSGGLFGVKIGNKNATSIVRVNSNTITAKTPAGTAGAKNVVVTNNDGQNATLASGFTYVAPPAITSMVGVYRPSIAKFILKNGTEKTVVPWGLGTDTPVAGDWNGDGMDDLGVYRPSVATFILKNGTERTVVPWGLGTDTPVTGDWNGDGMDDVGVYRPSVAKFILKNGTEKTVVPWGLGTDTPVAGNWNGDSMDDVGVYRPSVARFILKNGTEKTVVPWGLGTDTPVAGDWNGDGMDDVSVYRPSIATFILKNGTVKTIVPWGLSTDTPVTGRWR